MEGLLKIDVPELSPDLSFAIFARLAKLCQLKWCQQVRSRPYLPHAPGVRMTVVEQTPSNMVVHAETIAITWKVSAMAHYKGRT